MRTARSRTSGENLFNLLFMAPSSQRLEPPQNTGRFKVNLLALFLICSKFIADADA